MLLHKAPSQKKGPGLGPRPEVLTFQHLHQHFVEGVSLPAVEDLALVEASVMGLEVPQRHGEDATQGVIRNGRAPVAPLQEGQQPQAVRADHTLAQALFVRLPAPGLAASPVLCGVIGTGDPQGLALHTLEHCGVVGSGQLCRGDSNSTPALIICVLSIY